MLRPYGYWQCIEETDIQLCRRFWVVCRGSGVPRPLGVWQFYIELKG